MESILISIDYKDPLWIAIAFGFGLIVKQFKLPPMVGFLVAGFILHLLGAEGDQFLSAIADLGVTLLLFTIGLKLRLGSLLRPEIWATTLAHMGVTIVVITAFLMSLGFMGAALFADLDFLTAIIVAFALSFSSTVFAVKTLEDRGALASRYGQVAIGVLVMQDIAAVLFLAISAGKIPSPWALGLLLLIPARHLLGRMMEMSGHRELLAVFGFVMALGGAALFEMVGMKGDLGALIFGVLLASHRQASELAKQLLGFKDVFLVCFFLTIGLTGLPTWETAIAAGLLLLLLPFKAFGFFWLLARFRLRARPATLSGLVLGNYSEFGLIVGAIAISAGWLQNEWLTAIALALSASFVVASPLNALADTIYTRYRDRLRSFESAKRLPGDDDIKLSGNRILVFGMGRVGRAAYDQMREFVEDRITGIDLDHEEVARHCDEGRRVVHGDATNPEFWSRVDNRHEDLELILLAMPFHDANIQAAERLRERGFTGPIVSTALYPDQVESLKEHGVTEVFNIYAEAGSGAAAKMIDFVQQENEAEAEAEAKA
ncbi:MAG: cation:proton antiporter [Magnetovibrionaceae bacterium]